MLSIGEQILGWEIAIPTMKKGEKSRFLIKPEYAYGKMGCPPRIPAQATGKSNFMKYFDSCHPS